MTIFPQHHRGARLAVVAAVPAALALVFTCTALFRAANTPKSSTTLAIRQGDHICFIGNTLPDRMQHDGWLETILQSRFPKQDLSFRDLGFSGDEVEGFTDKPNDNKRLRSASFGSSDEWLTRTKADVVFAFFGYNESFAGPEGLEQFKKDLEGMIKHTLAQKYNGKTAPRLVLFSPIGHENLHDRNLPDGAENNNRLALYTEAMAAVAKANQIPFVDLYKPSLDLYAKAAKPLTIDGVHLNEEGDGLLAGVIDAALFAGGKVPTRDAGSLEKLRQAVLDKNFTWFNRYRTVDGYSIFGGRADLVFEPEKQTNRVVAQREMEILDVMTANRDKRIWSVAQGGDLKVDDGDTPPFIPVKTNKPGAGPNGEHIFLSGDEELKTMTVAKNMKVNLFASEKDWPDLAKPVQMQWDAKGRLWVAVWPSYPHWKPKDELNDKILIFEDTKGTGKADKCTVFADHLHCPTGFEFYNGGVLVAQAPDIMYLKASDGGDKADVRVRVLDGMDSADTHHTSNSFTIDPGGAVYWQEGTFHHTQVETPWGPSVRNANAGVYRYEPRTQKFDAYVTYGFANPHGHVWDRWGEDYVYDGTGANPYNGALFSGHLDYPNKHPHPPQVYQQRTRPCPGVEILSSRAFPEANQGNLLVGNVIGFQGILQYKPEDKGASLTATEVEPILYSTDPNFRPSDLKMGPDGAIYFLDWQNPIIGHMQHNLRDPSRDKIHGRIYRVTYEGRDLLKPAKIAGEPIEKLLELLKEPEDRVRYRAKIELGGRNSDEVIAAANKWEANLDKKDPQYEHNRLEALWVHQYHNVVDEDLLKRVLGSPDFHARAAATRVLCYWRDRVPDVLDLLRKLAADPAPRVRLEAVRAASFFKVPEAVEVALISADHPTDEYLDYVRTETMKALEPYVTKAIREGKDISFTTPAGARYLLKSVSTDDLLKMKRGQGVYLELLFRKSVRDEYRQEALTGLAKLEGKSPLHVLIEAVRNQDAQQTNQDESVVFDLVRLLTSRGAKELADVRPDLEKMATGAKLPVTRELGFAALVAADGGVDKAWDLALKSATALQDFVNAMPIIRDPEQRASLYPKVQALLNGMPKELASSSTDGKTVMGRYVRIELPGKKKTLTLAEVEVFSDGRNIARQGKASQINTSNGGDATRAIDGNTSGKYNDGGETHTEENTTNPWWEVDLGSEHPITSVAIFNRTDDGLGKRLDGFTLQVLDNSHKVVFHKEKQPAPAERVVYEVGVESPERAVRHAAMNGLGSVRGKESDTFTAIAPFIKNDADRDAAVHALQRIPVQYWPKEAAQPLLDAILAHVRKIPVAERTAPAVLDEMQLADALASQLPLEQAKLVRKELGELGVRVIRLSTLTDQMLYDKDRIVVQAGKPVEILFENNDLMPHNFVVLQPGSLEEIGRQNEATATDPGAIARGYVPNSPQVLLASRLLAPRDSQRLSYTAPAQPGVYPYVCTYPGHWRRMYGALYVVADLDEYRADAEGYLARHPMKVADEMLKYTGPRKEWTFAELAPLAEKLQQGRSFSNGKHLFQVTVCISCHKMNGLGNEFGPDVTKLDPKRQTPVEVLHDIVEPSFRINEKYQTWIFTMQDGKVITGLIIKTTPTTVEVIENPLAKTAPVVLNLSDIDTKKASPTSLMPKGLLDKLSVEEILDLVAYVTAGGNEHNKLFSGGHDHHHAAAP
jgi:putative heme-binding domain-containing protein